MGYFSRVSVLAVLTNVDFHLLFPTHDIINIALR